MPIHYKYILILLATELEVVKGRKRKKQGATLYSGDQSEIDIDICTSSWTGC